MLGSCGVRSVSGPCGLAKRVGITRRSVGRLGAWVSAVLGIAVLGTAVLGRSVPVGRTRASFLVRGIRSVHHDEYNADHAGEDDEHSERAETDAGAAEDEAHGGDEGRQGEQAEDNAADHCDVEAPLEGLLQVNAAVLGLGEHQPAEGVGERNHRNEKRGQDSQDAHERQIPTGAGGHARAHAADHARMRAVPTGIAYGIKETAAGRALLVPITGLRRAIGPTHDALPLERIHSARIDTTTQSDRGSAAIVGDPLNGP